MKVCFIIASLDCGGAERTVSYLSDFGCEKGFDIDIVTVSDKVFYTLNKKVRHYVLEDNKFNSSNILAGFYRLIKFYWYYWKHKPDVIFCMQPFGMKYCNKLLKKPIIIYSERSNPQNYKGNLKKKLRLIKQCDGVVFQTEGAKRFYNKLGIQNGVVIHNAIGNPDAYLFNTPSKCREKTVTAIGRLCWEKDYYTLIDGFKLFLENGHEEFILKIFGEGDLKNDISNYIIEKGLEKSVLLLGNDERVLLKAYNSSCYVLSSISEGMPNSLIEAMAIGLPCVATECDFGPEEIISDNRNGLLVECGKPEAISDAIQRIVDEDSFSKRIAEEAIKIRQTHSIDVICNKYYVLIKDCFYRRGERK